MYAIAATTALERSRETETRAKICNMRVEHETIAVIRHGCWDDTRLNRSRVEFRIKVGA